MADICQLRAEDVNGLISLFRRLNKPNVSRAQLHRADSGVQIHTVCSAWWRFGQSVVVTLCFRWWTARYGQWTSTRFMNHQERWWLPEVAMALLKRLIWPKHLSNKILLESASRPFLPQFNAFSTTWCIAVIPLSLCFLMVVLELLSCLHYVLCRMILFICRGYYCSCNNMIATAILLCLLLTQP